MLQVFYTKKFTKSYRKLPPSIQKKFDKQIKFLLKDLRYPSIQAKKEEGFENVWEGRVDRHYRFSFTIESDTIILLRVGPHDEGLGKK